MSSILQATTELEAVNIMLSNIGESPVNSFLDSDVVDAGTARNILASINREVQSHGWWFNTDINRRFLPNTAGEIVMPPNVLKVDTSGPDLKDKNLVLRGNRLYDRINHTYKISDSVILTLVLGLSFTDLPETARRYITIRAARIFQERMLGAPSISNFNMKDEAEANNALIAEDTDAGDFNYLTDSLTPQRILNRHQLIRG